MSVRCVLLLSGPLAVGKTAVRDELVAQHRFAFVRSSQYLRTQAATAGSKLHRLSLQDIGDQLDIDTDYRWLIDDVALPAMAADVAQNQWLVDAVRKARQVEHFRSSFGPAVVHVHLDAPESVLKGRYANRQKAQGISADPTSYEDAIDHDNERSARSLISLADQVIDVSDLLAAEIAQAIIKNVESRISEQASRRR